MRCRSAAVSIHWGFDTPQQGGTMQVEHPVCCGIDVYKDTLTACLRRVDANGQVSKEGREFATTYTSAFPHLSLRSESFLRSVERPLQSAHHQRRLRCRNAPCTVVKS